MSKEMIKNSGGPDFLAGKIKPMYFRYLTASFGSALISSIYGVVDMAMVGQYQGPAGTAALAVVSPVWNIIYSLGLLMGIGGSVLFSTLRGESEQNRKKSNEYFTAALIGVAILAAITWVVVIFFDRELLMLFGAEETLLPLAQRYLFPVKFAVPSFLLTQLMSAFLRNDGETGGQGGSVRRDFQRIRGLLFRFCFGYGNHGSWPCHRSGLCVFLAHHAHPFLRKKEYPSSGKA